MATITKRGEYQFRAVIRRAGFPSRSKTFESKRDAEVWVREVEGQMDKGSFIDRTEIERMTFDALVTKYKDEITVSKKGRVKEESKLRTLQASFLGRMTLAAIQPSDITTYRSQRLRSVGPATVTKEMNLISNIFAIGASEFHLRGLVNPVQGIRRPKAPKARNRRLLQEGDEMDRIITASNSKLLKVIIPFAVETAMRRSEMVSIKWKNLDYESQTVYLGDTKNDDSRVVPLSLKAIALLKTLTEPKDKELRIFPMEPSSVTHAFTRARDRARELYEVEMIESGTKPNPMFLMDLRLHDMRHEATSRLFEDKELEMMEVAAITGHRDFRQLKNYTHLRATRIAKKLG